MCAYSMGYTPDIFANFRKSKSKKILFIVGTL